MFLCDYRSDFGVIQNRYKPLIKGFNKPENKDISAQQILLIISDFISTDNYYEVGDKQKYCPLTFVTKARKLIYENSQYLIELEYPIPFTDIDWSIFNLQNRFETIGEFINDSDIQYPKNQIFNSF